MQLAYTLIVSCGILLARTGILAMIITKCTKNNNFAMTWDEGPSDNLPILLEILKQHKVHVSFHFVRSHICNRQKLALVKKCLEEGHEVGLKWESVHKIELLSKDKIREILTQHQVWYANTFEGKVLEFVRIPYGQVNAHNFLAVAALLGIVVTGITLDSMDYGKLKVEEIIDTFKIAITAHSEPISQISVQRDSSLESIMAVPMIIQFVKANGYQFVTLKECTSGAQFIKSHENPKSEGIDILVTTTKPATINIQRHPSLMEVVKGKEKKVDELNSKSIDYHAKFSDSAAVSSKITSAFVVIIVLIIGLTA